MKIFKVFSDEDFRQRKNLKSSNFSSKERKMLQKCMLIAGLGIKQIDAYKNVYGDLNLLQANQV